MNGLVTPKRLNVMESNDGSHRIKIFVRQIVGVCLQETTPTTDRELFDGQARVVVSSLGDSAVAKRSSPFTLISNNVELSGSDGSKKLPNPEFVFEFEALTLAMGVCVSLVAELKAEAAGTSLQLGGEQHVCGGEQPTRPRVSYVELGVVHISFDTLCRGRGTTTTHHLVLDAGTPQAVLNGRITVEVFGGEQPPSSEYILDEVYYEAYKEAILKLLQIVEPRELHKADMLMSEHEDLESLVYALEDRANEVKTKATHRQAEENPTKRSELPLESFFNEDEENDTLSDRVLAKPTSVEKPSRLITCTSGIEDDICSENSEGFGVSPKAQGREKSGEKGRCSEGFGIGEHVGASVSDLAAASIVDADDSGDEFPLDDALSFSKQQEANSAKSGTPDANVEYVSALSAVETEDSTGAVDIQINETCPHENERMASVTHAPEKPTLEATFEALGTARVSKPTAVHTFSVSFLSLIGTRDKHGSAALSALRKAGIWVNAEVPTSKDCKRLRAVSVSEDAKCSTFKFADRHGAAKKAVTLKFPLTNPTANDVLTITFETEEGSAIGNAHIALTRTFPSRSRRILIPIASVESLDRPVLGFVSLSVSCPTWSREANEHEAAGEPLTQSQATRIADFYAEYMPSRLHLVDFDLEGSEDFEAFIAGKVRQFGPEPDAYPLRVKLSKCVFDSRGGAKHDEKMSFSVTVNDTTVLREELVSVGKSMIRSKGGQYSITFNNSEVIFHGFASRRDDSGVLIKVLRSGKEHSRCVLSLSNVIPAGVVRRTVNLVTAAGTDRAFVSGTLSLDLTSSVGCISIPSEEDEQILRERITSLLSRHDPARLHMVDHMIGEFVGCEDALITRLIAQYECIPGGSRLAVTIKEISAVAYRRDTATELRVTDTTAPFSVKIKTHMEKISTRKISLHGILDETLMLTMATPEKDQLHLFVYSADEILGEAVLSLTQLQKGVPRTITAMLVRKAGTKHASCSGYISLILRSDEFGARSPSEIKTESLWRQRFKNFFRFHCPEKLHQIQSAPPTVEYLRKLVKTYGADEPLWVEATLTIIECNHVVDDGDSAAVALSCGLDLLQTRCVRSIGNAVHFNETFNLLVPLADKHEETATFTVFQRRDGIVFELGRATIPLSVHIASCEGEYEHVADIVCERPAAASMAAIVGSLRYKVSLGKRSTADFVGSRGDYNASMNFKDNVALRSKLECALFCSSPSDLHRLECIMAHGSHAVEEKIQNCGGVKKRGDNRTLNAGPFVTVRVRGLLASRPAQFEAKVSIITTRSETLLVTEPVTTVPQSFAAISSQRGALRGHANIHDIEKDKLVFTIIENGREVGSSIVDIANFEPNVINTRKLLFFHNRVHFASLVVDVRVAGLTVPRQVSPFDDALWAKVCKDICSLFAKYKPAELVTLDATARSTDNLEALHANLLSEIAIEQKMKNLNTRLSTLYFQNVSVEFVLDARKPHPTYVLEFSALGSRGASPESAFANLSCDTARLCLPDKVQRLKDSDACLWSGEMEKDGSSPDQYSTIRFVSELESIRLDFVSASVVSVRLLEVSNTNVQNPIAEGEIPFEELAESEEDYVYELPVCSERGDEVAKVSFSIGYPLENTSRGIADRLEN